MPFVMFGRGNTIFRLIQYLNFFLFDALGSGTFRLLRTEIQP